jgi:tRNA 2-thiocytidine biosynthesis protein TtcA
MRTIDLESPNAIKIRKQMVEAIATYKLIEEGDKLMVCCSGGKDSSIMLTLLKEIQRRAPYNYTLEAVMLDQKQPGFDAGAFRSWVAAQDIKLTIIERDTYSIVKEKVTSGTYCSLCSRLRRAILYDHAVDHGFTKLVLGHHRDDLNQTLLLNLFYTGKISSMPPKLKSDDGRNILIRPMMKVDEGDIKALAKEWEIPIIPCNLCGSQEGMKRQLIKKKIKELEGLIPNIQTSMLTAQTNIRKTQLADSNLQDFNNLKPEVEKLDYFTGFLSEP